MTQELLRHLRLEILMGQVPSHLDIGEPDSCTSHAVVPGVLGIDACRRRVQMELLPRILVVLPVDRWLPYRVLPMNRLEHIGHPAQERGKRSQIGFPHR